MTSYVEPMRVETQDRANEGKASSSIPFAPTPEQARPAPASGLGIKVEVAGTHRGIANAATLSERSGTIFDGAVSERGHVGQALTDGSLIKVPLGSNMVEVRVDQAIRLGFVRKDAAGCYVEVTAEERAAATQASKPEQAQAPSDNVYGQLQEIAPAAYAALQTLEKFQVEDGLSAMAVASKLLATGTVDPNFVNSCHRRGIDPYDLAQTTVDGFYAVFDAWAGRNGCKDLDGFRSYVQANIPKSKALSADMAFVTRGDMSGYRAMIKEWAAKAPVDHTKHGFKTFRQGGQTFVDLGGNQVMTERSARMAGLI